MNETSYLGDDYARTSNISQPPIKRLRKKAPKSRNGCSRCKKRRIKCDEEHPACDNCLKIGCQCPGFQQELRWSRKHQRVQKSSAVGNDEETSYPSPVVAFSIQHSSDSNNGLVESYSSPRNDFNDWSVDYDPPTPILPLDDSWSFTPENCGVSLEHGRSSEEENHLVRDGVLLTLDSPDGLDTTINPGILRTLAHPPTMLIEHWFRHICPLWSAFDSAVSYSRHLALSSWGSSKPVFYTIQAMSAAYISVTMPQFHGTLNSLKSLAVRAIEAETRLLRSAQSPTRITADLIYAIFTLGNSVNWTATGMDENPWLESARELVSKWSLDVSISDAPIHTYFCQALTYWEMLLAARGRGSVPGKLAKRRQRYHKKIQQAMGLPDSRNDNDDDPCEDIVYGPDQALLRIGTRPNSWSGVSDEVIDVFGQVLALCYHARRSRHKSHESFNAKTATLGLCDVSLAHELQRELLKMDFESLILIDEVNGFPVQTQDENTPTAHLLQTAEAYRQAALLQLHLSFHDLTTPFAPTMYGLPDADPGMINHTIIGDGRSRKENALSMTLSLVNTLEQIPGQSGSRSIHLMLYLSAAVGLQVGNSFAENYESDHRTGGLATSDTFNPIIGMDTFFQDLSGANTAASVDKTVTRSTLEVSRARQFILARLGGLQQTLPHRRVDSTIEFAKDIWKKYDTQNSQPSSIVHWLDAMGSRVTLW